METTILVPKMRSDLPVINEVKVHKIIFYNSEGKVFSLLPSSPQRIKMRVPGYDPSIIDFQTFYFDRTSVMTKEEPTLFWEGIDYFERYNTQNNKVFKNYVKKIYQYHTYFIDSEDEAWQQLMMYYQSCNENPTLYTLEDLKILEQTFYCKPDFKEAIDSLDRQKILVKE